MPGQTVVPSLACRRCGKPIRSSSVWGSRAVHCSTFCGARPVVDVDIALERAIVFFLQREGKAVPLRRIAEHVGHDDWQEHMQDAREAAGRLDAAGHVTVTVVRHHDGDVVWLEPRDLTPQPASRMRLQSGVRRRPPSRILAATKVA